LKSKKIGAIARRLPSLMVLDDLKLSIPEIRISIADARDHYGSDLGGICMGRYLGWDPKETWSLITWFLYAALLHQPPDGGVEGAKGGHYGHHRIPGRPFHVPGCQPSASRPSQLRQLVGTNRMGDNPPVAQGDLSKPLYKASNGRFIDLGEVSGIHVLRSR